MDERKAVRVSMWMDFTTSDYLLTIRRLLENGQCHFCHIVRRFAVE